MFRNQMTVFALAALVAAFAAAPAVSQPQEIDSEAALLRDHHQTQILLGEIYSHVGDVPPYRFRSEEVVAIEAGYEQIRDLLREEDWDSGAELASVRLASAEALLENVIADHAAAALEEAETRFQIIQDNDGAQLDAERFAQIQEAFDAMGAAWFEGRLTDVIEQAQVVITEADLLLGLLSEPAAESP